MNVMKKLYPAIALAALAAVFMLVAFHVATVDKAVAMSNGAPQLNCVQCHQDAKNRPAEFTVEGLPEKVEPGKEYKITIKITGGVEGSMGGFAFWASAGDLVVVDEKNTFKTNTADGTIITHTKDGSQRREWSLAWKAPDKCNGPITFKISVIAANGDGSFMGDAYGYKEITVQCAAPSGGAGGEASPTKTAATSPPETTAAGGQAQQTITETSPVSTVTERNTALAVGVAVLIFILVAAGYLMFARK